MMKRAVDYISPEIDVIDFIPEGILCNSNEHVDEYPGSWGDNS